MCNLAGYVGSRPAAPILLDMLLREEGWAGGYYTGLATVAQERLFARKTTGDVERLLSLTDAAALPGSAGLAHSRSMGGGGDAWAHPFLDKDGTLAYQANGGAGYFKDGMLRCRKAAELFEAGFTMSSRSTEPMSDYYPLLPDGSHVHLSDVMCQLIARRVKNGEDPTEAMAGAFCEMPSEIVGLALFACVPDRIYFSRVNQPMALGRSLHGTYLSTTPMAFPEDVTEVVFLPALSAGFVTADDFSVLPYEKAPCTVAGYDEAMIEAAEKKILEHLSEPRDFQFLAQRTVTLYPPADTCDGDNLLYEALRRLKAEKRIGLRTIRVPGARPDLTAPHLLVSLL